MITGQHRYGLWALETVLVSSAISRTFPIRPHIMKLNVVYISKYAETADFRPFSL